MTVHRQERSTKIRGALRGAVSVTVLATLLASCAGGGSGATSPGGPTTPTPPTPPAPPSPPSTPGAFRTLEYQTSWALEAIHAAEAYALGYTGDGVVVGIVDFNFALSSLEVDYHSASRGRDAQAIEWYEDVFGDGSVDNDPHGHAVAAAAAAQKNNSGIHGVAFNAQIMGVDYFSRVNETTEIHSGITYHISDPWTYLTSRGVRIINKSFGYDEGDSVPIPLGVTQLYVIASAVTAVENGALLVSAAGNNAGANPTLSNRDIVSDIEGGGLTGGPGAFIIAGAVKQTVSGYEISSFSNRAGSYGNYFLVAPGEDVVLPYAVPECGSEGLCYANGTSFAAPMIAGAAALVMQRWPTLTAKEIAEILFASATDLGAPGIDSIYGQGMLNVYEALQPIGVTTLALDAGMAFSAEQSGMVLGTAFGDAPALRAAFGNVALFDSFHRDFGMDFSKQVWAAPQATLSNLFAQKRRWHGAQYRLGAAEGVAVHLYDTRDVDFASSNGLETPDTYRGVVRLNGQSGDVSWTAGTGLGLGAALSNEQTPFAPSPLTRAFSTMLGSDAGYFATGEVALGERTSLSFGVSHADEAAMQDHYIPGLRSGTPVNAAALRLDYRGDDAVLSAEAGSALEQGAILGTHGTGALALADRAASVWTTLGGVFAIAENWSLSAMASLALTNPERHPGGLVASFEPVLSYTSSLGVVRSDLFLTGDALSFTIHQPLRAEQADLTLFSGAGLDPATGEGRVERQRISLLPSGREIAFEAGYGAALGAWTAEASIAFRRDAGHVSGRNDGAAMLWLARAF